MINRRIALAGLTAVAIGLTGCAGMGGTTDSGADAPATDADGVTTIDFWSNHPGSSKDLELELIAAFEAENPDIKVKLTDAGKNYEEVAQKFNAALSGGQVPDLVVASDVTWFNFALNDQLAPLDDLLEQVGAEPADYVPNLYDEYIFDGSHFAVPYARSTPLFYYNKDMWQAAGLPDRGPATWEEWNTDFAPKLAAANPDVTPLVIPDGSLYMDWYFQGMIWSMGGAYSKDYTMTMSSPESVKAGEFLQSQFEQGYFKAVKEATAPFVSGQGAAMLESTGSLNGVSQDGKVNVGTAFLPSPDGVPGCPTGGAGIGIPAKSEKKEAAAKFLAFLTNAENTITFSQATGYMPVRTSAKEMPEAQAYFEENPNFKTAVDQLEFTQKQDAGRVYVSGGGMRIGAALDKISQGADVASTFKQIDEEQQAMIDSDIKPKLK
ncbi:MAG: ABC transporter substrate-binding protein [Actinomycetaceae bacterium]|nr:ABC transporter substrate-binding protein [Actinomycetaceae bacterium]MDO5035231.1 ABC transporter substrate-binding protein [Actinomycetaceae bacterium]